MGFSAQGGTCSPTSTPIKDCVTRLGFSQACGNGGLNLAKRSGDHQQAMRTAAHQPKTIDENRAFRRKGAHKIRQILALHDADIL